jgi:hypothetical protein
MATGGQAAQLAADPLQVFAFDRLALMAAKVLMSRAPTQ